MSNEPLLAIYRHATKSSIDEIRVSASQQILQILLIERACKNWSVFQSQHETMLNSGETQWYCTEQVMSHIVAALAGRFAHLWDKENKYPHLTNQASSRLNSINSMPTGSAVGVVYTALKTHAFTKHRRKIRIKYSSDDSNEVFVTTLRCEVKISRRRGPERANLKLVALYHTQCRSTLSKLALSCNSSGRENIIEAYVEAHRGTIAKSLNQDEIRKTPLGSSVEQSYAAGVIAWILYCTRRLPKQSNIYREARALPVHHGAEVHGMPTCLPTEIESRYLSKKNGPPRDIVESALRTYYAFYGEYMARIAVCSGLTKSKKTIRCCRMPNRMYFNAELWRVVTVQGVTMCVLSRARLPTDNHRLDMLQSHLLPKCRRYLVFCKTQISESYPFIASKRQEYDTASVVTTKKLENVHSHTLGSGPCRECSAAVSHGHRGLELPADRMPIEVSDEDTCLGNNELSYVEKTNNVQFKLWDVENTTSKGVHGACRNSAVDDHECQSELLTLKERVRISKEKDGSIFSQAMSDLLLEPDPKRLLSDCQRTDVVAYPVYAVYRCSPLQQLASASHENRSHIDVLRLASFKSWSNLGKQSALRCCAAGFSRTTTGRISSAADDLTCFSCGCTVSGLTPGVDPLVLHYDKCGQHCSFVAGFPRQGAVSKDNAKNVPYVTEFRAEISSLAPVLSADFAVSSVVEQPNVTDCLRFFGLLPFTVKSATRIDAYRPAAMAVAASRSVMVKQVTAGSRSTAAHLGESSAPSTEDDDLAKHESYRLSTFANVWVYDHIVNARELSRNGFLYAGPGDRVRCAFCQGLLRNWEPGDCAGELHAKHFTYCRFVQGHDVGNVPIPFWPLTAERSNDAPGSADTTGGTPADLGISSAVPSNPDLAVEARRLATFATWPAGHHMQPEILAKAGFFYLGNEDAVQCFFCDCVVMNWKTHCDPWVEHAQHCPNCSFVVQVQGRDFVSQHRMADGQASSGTKTATSLAVDPREIRARMDSNMARILFRMDYPVDLVREVIQRRLATVGSDHETSEQLLDDVFQTHDKKQRASTAQNATGCGTAPAVQPVIVSHPRCEASNNQDETTSRSTTATTTVTIAVAASAPIGPEARDFLAANGSLLTRERVPLVAKLRSDEENRQLKTQLTCKVCMDALVGIVFLPCGHLVCCPECAPAMKTCPICRVSIRGTVRTII